ncbi:MAG: ribonuclease P protein subunit [Candidatus Diapherotrites archaeon]|uniref:Ribonuclease P protein component 1 n=1 Tax=Candidatus Iainarchaeum sp. TaxID=3101447 RepID=A0A938YX05_9ARCH|nr:ribonuclease P protein subunit [Candidatus Diapherotrites archaeon]
MLKKKKYSITRQNIAAHEWIGLQAVVSSSPDKSRIGLKGKIVDETKNLVVIETEKGEKKLPKREVSLKVKLGKEDALLDCSKLQQRPEDRVKYWGGKAT